MRQPAKTCAIERLFIPAAAAVLPVGSAKIDRTERGILYYYWPSPCEALVGLYVYLNKHEIMLSTKIFHTHVDNIDFLRESLHKKDLPARIVERGVTQVLEILGGETLFIKFYDPAGKESGSTGSSPRQGWADPQRRADWIAFHGEGWTARAWNWFGEVTDS